MSFDCDTHVTEELISNKINILASACQDVSEVVQRLPVLLLIILPFRVIHRSLSGPTGTTPFYLSEMEFIRSLQNMSFSIQNTILRQMVKSAGRPDSECRDLCIESMRSLTVLRALHGRGLCKQVAPCERQLSRPSVCSLWPSCHRQSLSPPCLLAFGCDLCYHTKRGLHPLNSPCSCTLRTHHSSGGVFPSLAFYLCLQRKIMDMNPVTDPHKQSR